MIYKRNRKSLLRPQKYEINSNNYGFYYKK